MIFSSLFGACRHQDHHRQLSFFEYPEPFGAAGILGPTDRRQMMCRGSLGSTRQVYPAAALLGPLGA